MFIYLPPVSQFNKDLLIENQAKIKKELDRINEIMSRNIFEIRDKAFHIIAEEQNIKDIIHIPKSKKSKILDKLSKEKLENQKIMNEYLKYMGTEEASKKTISYKVNLQFDLEFYDDLLKNIKLFPER